MHILIWVSTIVLGYFFLAFVVLRLVAPFMGFGGYKLPVKIPDDMKNTIAELERKTFDQYSYLQAAYEFVPNRWYITRGLTVIFLPLLFRRDIKKIWNSPGFAHCTTMNFILYALLAHSKYFTAEDVRVKHVFLNMVPHQYLQVCVGEKWIDADPAALSQRNFSLGRHASFFG